MGEWPLGGDQVNTFPDDAEEAARVERVRQDLPALGREAYLNNGTFGPLPRQSVEAMREVLDRESAEGRIGPHYHERSRELAEQTRGLLARRFGLTDDEVALTPRTTDGLNIALWGIDWRSGDEVLTTRDEHPGLLVPLATLVRRAGVRVMYVETPREPSRDAWLQAFASRRSGRTRAIAFSHVLWTNGDVLPVDELGGWARREGVLSLVDGAQAAGALACDLRRSQLDFYAMPGQKWLCGPDGTGALYVARERIDECLPSFVGYLSGTSADAAGGGFEPAQGARRYEIGSLSQAQLAGLAASLLWQEEHDPAWAALRISALGAELRQSLQEIPGLEILTRRQEEASGLVSFRVAGRAAEDVSAELGQAGFRVRDLPAPHASVRVSCGFYTLREELVRLVEAVTKLAGAV